MQSPWQAAFFGVSGGQDGVAPLKGAERGAVGRRMWLPRRNQRVTLVLPDREMLAARMEAEAGDALDLALMRAPRTPPDDLERARLFLEWMTPDGVQRRPGSLRLRDDQPIGDPFGVFSVARFTPAGEPQLLRSPEHVHAAHVAAVMISPPGHDAVAALASTVTVWGGGLLVRGAVPIEEGDEVDITLSALEEGRRPIRARCRVGRGTPSGERVLQFTRMGAAEREELIAF